MQIMAENAQNNALDTHLPPKTPIEQIQASIDYSLSILHGLTCENSDQYEAKERAQAHLVLFQEDPLHELRKAFEQ